MIVVGEGSVDIPIASGGIKLDEVLYVPGVTKNLISLGTITDDKQDLKVLFDSKSVWILRNISAPDSLNIVATGKRDTRNGLYRFRPPDGLVNIAAFASKQH